MSFGDPGRMLIVDASCLFEVVTGRPKAAAIARRLLEDSDQAAPHIVDFEVFGMVRREFLRQALDHTTAVQAVDDLRLWSGERFGHGPMLARAWELRDTVRGWDAMYVRTGRTAGRHTANQRSAAGEGQWPAVPDRGCLNPP